VSFRGYADYMQTDDFEVGLEQLLALAARHSPAIMCAEAVPWRCHRSLIADALTARGQEVWEIIGRAQPRLHSMTPFARVVLARVDYPPADIPVSEQHRTNDAVWPAWVPKIPGHFGRAASLLVVVAPRPAGNGKAA